jgi:hypothetical protein
MGTHIVEYNLESFGPFVHYVLALYAGLTNKNFLLVEISPSHPEYDNLVVGTEYNPQSFEFKAPIIHDKSICKKQLSSTNEDLYPSFLNFVSRHCFVKNSTFLKVKANDLVKEFSIDVGVPIDIRNVFPAIMARFMKEHPFITRKGTNKGIIYIGINLMKDISVRLMQNLTEENQTVE